MILDDIIARTRCRLDTVRQRRPLAELLKVCEQLPAGDSERFRRQLTSRYDRDIRLLAEIKKASPSRGVIRDDFVPSDLAQAYRRGHTSAISVLTEPEFFQGRLDYLTRVSRAVDLPLLRKDFIIDEYQLAEARAAGAAAVLLIAAALDDDRLHALHKRAAALGLACLVEAHDATEVRRACELDGAVVGINNRDLRTFEVSLDTVLRLENEVPADVPLVCESGILSHDDISYVTSRGRVRAFLIGEGLMRYDDPARGIEQLLLGGPRRIRRKVCGITRRADAEAAAAAGFDTVGFIFYDKSPRVVTVAEAARISQSLSPLINRVGVFVNAPPEEVRRTAAAAALDFIQLHGDEDTAYMRSLSDLRLIKATAAGYAAAAEVSDWPVEYVLLDHRAPGQRGGTGRTCDWDLARRLARSVPLILSGGLGPDNAAAAVETVRPTALDVNSGVEDAPGRKNREKMGQLIEAVPGDL